jgi:hypothetical protein
MDSWMIHARCSAPLALSIALSACTGSASARLELANQTAVSQPHAAAVLADGTSLRLKVIAVYLAEDVDPVTQDNIGRSAMIWLNPECADDTTGKKLPAGPRVMQYFDLARPTAEVNAQLNSQDLAIEPATYRYARIELCRPGGDQPQAMVPTLMWKGPGMTSEESSVSGDCARSSLPFDPPMVVDPGDAVTVSLGYDLATAVVAGAPHADAPHCSLSIAGHDDASGEPHCFRACVNLSTDQRVCMDFPELAPSAARL